MEFVFSLNLCPLLSSPTLHPSHLFNRLEQRETNKVLERVYKKINSKKCDLLFGNLIYFNNKNYGTRVWSFPVKNLNCLTALKIASPTVFIKRKIALSNPFNTDYHISSDIDFNLRISKKNLNYVYLNEFIILMKTGGLSTNYKFFPKKIAQDILILRKHFKVLFLFVYLYKVFIKLRIFKINKKLF